MFALLQSKNYASNKGKMTRGWQPLVGNRVNIIILYLMDLGTTTAWLCMTAIINPVHHMMYPVHHIMYPIHHMMATPIHHMMDI